MTTTTTQAVPLAYAKPKPGMLEYVSDATFRGVLLAFAGIVLFLIVLVKSRTVGEFFSDPLLLSYTVFISVFQLSRLLSATYYRSSYNQIFGTSSSAQALAETYDRSYEPRVSFVIPCMNEEEAIAHTIAMCYEADYPSELLEVIVINDGSTDGTAAEIDRMKKLHPGLVVVTFEKNRGKRHGMAEGFRRAQGEIVIQLDSDSYIEPSEFRPLITPFKNPEIGAVCAHADPTNADTNWITRMQSAYYYMSFRILKAAESTYFTVLCCSGCSSAYRKDVVLPILDSWLAETFLGKVVTWGDDRSLTSWVLKQGYSTVYSDLARAYTIVPDTFKKFVKQQVRWKKSTVINTLFTARFIAKKDPFVAFAYFFPLTIATVMTPFMAARALIYMPFSHDPWNAAYYLFGIMLMTSLLVIFYRWIGTTNKYWPYLYLWAVLNAICLSMLLFYSVATIQNRGWGTRG